MIFLENFNFFPSFFPTSGAFSWSPRRWMSVAATSAAETRIVSDSIFSILGRSFKAMFSLAGNLILLPITGFTFTVAMFSEVLRAFNALLMPFTDRQNIAVLALRFRKFLDSVISGILDKFLAIFESVRAVVDGFLFFYEQFIKPPFSFVRKQILSISTLFQELLAELKLRRAAYYRRDIRLEPSYRFLRGILDTLSSLRDNVVKGCKMLADTTTQVVKEVIKVVSGAGSLVGSIFSFFTKPFSALASLEWKISTEMSDSIRRMFKFLLFPITFPYRLYKLTAKTLTVMGQLSSLPYLLFKWIVAWALWKNLYSRLTKPFSDFLLVRGVSSESWLCKSFGTVPMYQAAIFSLFIVCFLIAIISEIWKRFSTSKPEAVESKTSPIVVLALFFAFIAAVTSAIAFIGFRLWNYREKNKDSTVSSDTKEDESEEEF